MNRDDEIRMRALRAARAVTMGAMFTGAIACTEEPGTSNNREWPTGNNTSPTDMSTTPDVTPPTPDMTPDVVVTPDMDPPEPDMVVTPPDMDPPEPDMTPNPCDDQGGNGVCPAECAPKDDVDCCTDLTDELRECTFDAALGCECVDKPQCLPQADGECPSTCNEKTDADCCAATAAAGFTCTFDPAGVCDCEPDVGICDMGNSDSSCPGNCSEMDDSDCCVASAPEGKECRWGGFGFGLPFPGCGCRDIPMCEATRDNICPDYCTSQTDADCCSNQASQQGEACVLGANGCECTMQVACDNTQTDGLCPMGCTTQKDADCCEADGFCNFDANSQQCFCAVPGPFVPPTMRRRNARRRRDS